MKLHPDKLPSQVTPFSKELCSDAMHAGKFVEEVIWIGDLTLSIKTKKHD